MAPSKVSLKLLVDKTRQKVLFAEAGKDFVDFLFSIMCLPVATVIRLLNKEDMVGCLANLYQSINDLNNDYMQSHQKKSVLLEPTSSIPSVVPQVPLLPLEGCSSMVATTLYKCTGCTNGSLSYTSRTCPYCHHNMSTTVTHYVPKAVLTPAPETAPATDANGGFVKGVVTYMVMDDLVVTPMSTISSITLLNKFNVKEVGALEEKIVDVGMDQGVELLKNALCSTAVLTNVFLLGKPKMISVV